MRKQTSALIAVIALAAFAFFWFRAPSPESASAPPPDPNPQELQTSMDRMLTESAAAWNGGDLDGFISWYRPGPQTTYIGSTGLIRGRDAIRERYAPLFQDGAERDSLRFENLETRPLGPALGLAVANYVLFQGDSTTAYGIFSLVVEEGSGGWRIVHDHSSALPER